MSDDHEVSAGQRLFDAAARWDAGSVFGPAELIDAACTALIDGLDSPALRELAGASPRESSTEVDELIDRTLDELGLPRRDAFPPGHAIVRAAGIDELRLAVAPAPADAGGGFQVEIYVNGIEMTASGAGLGMDPYHLLVPADPLRATTEPRRVPVARCLCGEYGCGATDALISRDGDRVIWDWLAEAPMHRGVSFDANAYDAEVDRAAADHSWETPDRTAGRLVLARIDRTALAVHGLTLGWVAANYRDPRLFRLALRFGGDYQVFLDTPWRKRDPHQLADAILKELARGPAKWRATWHAITPDGGPPPIASRSWRQEA